MANFGPSEPRHPTREGFATSRFFRESAAAHLGPISAIFARSVQDLRFVDLTLKRFQFKGLDFLSDNFY